MEKILEWHRYRIPLQFFADDGDKTEQPTDKRRREARKKGQVLKSQELVSSVVLLTAFIILRAFGGTIYGHLYNISKKSFSEYMLNVNEIFTIPGLMNLLVEIIIYFLQIMLPVFLVIMAVGVIINVVQSGFMFTTEVIRPKFENINPLKGLKNTFSIKSVAEYLLKALAKVIIVGWLAYTTIQEEMPKILNIMDLEVANLGIYIMDLCVGMGIKISIALVGLSFVDYIVQWRKYNKGLMMTKQEVKEEYKQTEGNPQIKSKIRQKQRAMAMNRMMQEIPKADVVITNPTHFAVAIKYDAEKASAPIVIAKGADYVAMRIKEIAKENKIEIVENKPLARALFASVEVGQEIPEELYQAVAEVLAFVYALKQ